MKVCIDLDDYHSFPKYDCTDVIIKLLSHYPDMKFTLFLTPFMKKRPLSDYPQALDRLKELIKSGNVEVFLHGLTHIKFFNGEFGGISKKKVKARIQKAERTVQKAGIDYKKGIKFPWNMYNKNTLRIVEELGYVLFSNNYEKRFQGKQIIWKNHDNIKKRYLNIKCYKKGRPELPQKDDIVYYHGHAQNIGNTGIRESLSYFMSELKELEAIDKLDFIFCSQL
jgi:peptidoglycan/xylan/chitin deacetylase (PgdA/CDA1 family)